MPNPDERKRNAIHPAGVVLGSGLIQPEEDRGCSTVGEESLHWPATSSSSCGELHQKTYAPALAGIDDLLSSRGSKASIPIVRENLIAALRG